VRYYAYHAHIQHVWDEGRTCEAITAVVRENAAPPYTSTPLLNTCTETDIGERIFPSLAAAEEKACALNAQWLDGRIP